MNKSTEEKQFTSTTTKLLHNLDRLQEIQQGIIRPISIQIAPTDKCNLKCTFCSVANREMDELSYVDAIKAIIHLRNLGAKTVEITGGGDPTMYPWINNIIAAYSSFGLKLGLITNGVSLKKKVSPECLSLLSWLRISLNCLDYVQDIDMPTLPDDVTLGFSYVWNELSDVSKLEEIRSYKETHGAKYVRIVPDCRSVKFIEDYKSEILPIIDKMEGMDNAFLQTKEYVPPHRCWMGYVKPFINSDGYIYHCSANPLIDLKFNEKFRMGHINDIEEIWGNVKPFDSKNCGECFFKEHNVLLEDVMSEVEHDAFI